MRFGLALGALPAIAALAALCEARVAAAESPWTLARQSEGIAVYTREVADSPLKEFRGEVEIATTVDRVLGAIGDPATLRDWLPDVLDCRLLRATDTERFVYIETEAPWPVSNRDGVYRFTFAREGEVATVRVEALPDYVPRRPGLVRIPRSDGAWRIEPTARGVKAAYRIHADPGGYIPAWIANAAVVRIPHKTLEGLRRHVLSPAPERPGCS